MMNILYIVLIFLIMGIMQLTVILIKDIQKQRDEEEGIEREYIDYIDASIDIVKKAIILFKNIFLEITNGFKEA